jgi:predicted site-specific integrase-resolvase
MPWLKSNAAQKILDVHGNTLRRWADTGLIKFIRTPGGIRLYDVESVTAADGSTAKAPETRHAKIAYCRVSSAKQKDDLERQVSFMRAKCPGYEIVTDVGSGLNFKRKGLRSILERALSGDVQEVCVSHRDRLCRFGFELISWILQRQCVKLVVLSNESTSPQQEFTEDLLAIVHVFSCRFNGLRRYAKATQEEVEGGVAEDIGTEGGEGGQAGKVGNPLAEDTHAVNEGAKEEDVQLDGSGEVHVQQVRAGGKKRKVSLGPEPAEGSVCHRKRKKFTATADGASGEKGSATCQ